MRLRVVCSYAVHVGLGENHQIANFLPELCYYGVFYDPDADDSGREPQSAKAFLVRIWARWRLATDRCMAIARVLKENTGVYWVHE